MTSAQVFRNGVCAGSPFPSPPGQTYIPNTASSLTVWAPISATGNFALPSDNDITPAPIPATDPRHHFIVGNPASLLSIFRVVGGSAFGSINTALNGGGFPFR